MNCSPRMAVCSPASQYTSHVTRHTSHTRVTVLVLDDGVVQQLVRAGQLAVDEPGEVGGGVAAGGGTVQYSAAQYLEEVQLSRKVSPSL